MNIETVRFSDLDKSWSTAAFRCVWLKNNGFSFTKDFSVFFGRLLKQFPINLSSSNLFWKLSLISTHWVNYRYFKKS